VNPPERVRQRKIAKKRGMAAGRKKTGVALNLMFHLVYFFSVKDFRDEQYYFCVGIGATDID